MSLCSTTCVARPVPPGTCPRPPPAAERLPWPNAWPLAVGGGIAGSAAWARPPNMTSSCSVERDLRHAHHRPVGSDAVGDLRPAPGVRPRCASRAFLEHPPVSSPSNRHGAPRAAVDRRDGDRQARRDRRCRGQRRRVDGLPHRRTRGRRARAGATGRRHRRWRRVGARCPQARRRRDGVRLRRRGARAGRGGPSARLVVAHPCGDGVDRGVRPGGTMASRRSPSMSWSTPPEPGATSSPRLPIVPLGLRPLRRTACIVPAPTKRRRGRS